MQPDQNRQFDQASDAPSGVVEVEVACDPHVNYAMHQNDVPVIKRISLRNTGDTAVEDLCVRAWLGDELSRVWEARIATIGPEATYNLNTVDLPLNAAVLARQVERQRTDLIVEVTRGDECLRRWMRSVDVLAYNEWPGIGSLPELLAALILPNHPAIQATLVRARQHLEQATGQPALSGYQSKDSRHVAAMVEAIYRAVADHDVGYINPPASFERQGQKVRLPDELISHRLGTCFDLTLFVAACFEQAGLHPLIVLLNGHAFVAVWAGRNTFPEPVVDEALRVRKRVQLGEILAVETTALTNRPIASFAEAQRMALRHLEDVGRFICAVDVKAARARSIRPLPTRIAEGAVSLLAEGPPVAEGEGEGAAPLSMPSISGKDVDESLVDVEAAETDAADDEPVETPNARLERWKRRLLDLSLRNRVLNYRESAKSIPLLCPDVAQFEDVLASGQRFSLLAKPKLMQDDQRDADLHRERTGEDALHKLLLDDLAKRRLHANLTEQELERRQLELFRSARTAVEESGVSTLYLAIGFLAWYESRDSDVQRLAPILLVPVELERATARAQFTLKQSDDEPRINVTLLEKLKVDFDMETAGLDELTTDESGVDVPLILRRFRELIKDEDRWDVLEQAHLGLFSFTKFLMWRDLQDRADTLMKNRVVRFLVERPGEVFEDAATFPRVDELDEKRSPIDTFCPRDADSSQLAAIYAAHDGRSFVLQGPPGTGKSQTITNLIAHCLSHGKRVLFVSEKMAALNVVHRRLAESGLAPFCLELHSHKANKREVLAQLDATLNVAQQRPPQTWERHAEQLTAARAELNALVTQLHAARPLGMSVYQVTSRLIALRNAARLDIAEPSPESLTAEAFQRYLDVAERLANAAATVGVAAHHPLRAIRRGEWQTSLPDDVLRITADTAEALQTFTERAAALHAALALPIESPSRNVLVWLAQLWKLLQRPPRPSDAMLREKEWPEVSVALRRLVQQGVDRDAERDRLTGIYQPEVLDENLIELRGNLVAATKKWFLPRYLGARTVRHKLAVYLRDGTLPDNETLLTQLDELIHLKRATAALADPSCLGHHYFSAAWRNGEADWTQLNATLDWCDQFHQHLSDTPFGDANGDMRERILTLASEQRDRFLPDNAEGRNVTAWLDAFDALNERLDRIVNLLDVDRDIAFAPPDAPDTLGQIAQSLTAWRDHITQLNDWIFWRRVRHEAVQANLSPLVDAYERGDLQPREFRDAVEHTLLRQWFNATCDSIDVLRQFNSAEHQQRIERFRQLDRDYLELTKQAVAARLAAQVPQVFGEPSANSEMGILKRQLSLQRRHMPVRKLLEKLPHLLPRLKPCLLMSPLSVAQYLDADFPPFDIVVFDEASQIPVWDAVGAIARGSEVIVVGDSRQLPPTNFFTKMSDEAVEDEDDFEELESVLDECVASQIPAMRLQWHYRSRHESLITFSNYHYYDNALYTFPSPVAETQRLGVSFRHIDGVYDRGRSRTNRAEALAIRDEIVRRLLEPGDDQSKSIGVVTFSLAQQELIENLLDEARREHPQIEPWFSDDRPEPVFIKNLENVQGDERAVILFSICYAADEAGKLPMTFGPINRDGGERRLNVAITRAREQVIVFSSIRADAIDLNRTNAVGVKHLKSFLDYAERGPAAIAEAVTLDPNAAFDSPFERDVCEALEARGWQVDRQVGCSGYRIDLAVRDPERPGAYLLGIECDGAFYHSGRTARDRDRLRQAVLESLGWKLHRIWSRDWWLNPQGVLAKLDEALGEAQRAPQPLFAAAPAVQPSVPAIDAPAAEPPKRDIAPNPSTDERGPQPIPPGMFLYEAFTTRRLFGTADAFYEPSRNERIAKLILDILEKEAPISIDLLTRRLMPLWDLNRRTSRVDDRIAELLRRLQTEGHILMRDTYLWLATQHPDAYVGFRVPASEDDKPRDLDDVPPEERANACLTILRQQISLPPEDLAREAARLLGYPRLTGKTHDLMRQSIDQLIDKELCIMSGDMVTLRR